MVQSKNSLIPIPEDRKRMLEAALASYWLIRWGVGGVAAVSLQPLESNEQLSVTSEQGECYGRGN
jgi:hypothetical protein